MNDLLLSPLSPALILACAGALLRIVARPRRSSTLALLALAPLGLTMLLLVRLRTAGVIERSSTWWPLVIPRLQVTWVLDGWNWLALLLLLLVATVAVLLTWRQPGKRTGAFHGLSLLLVAGAALTVVSGSFLALSVAWVATDILLVARARGGRATPGRAPVGLVATGSLLFLLAIGITSLTTASASLATAALSAETLVLLLVACMLRMAAYPLHLWLAPNGVPRDRGTQLLINGVILVTGGWLLGRLYSIGAAFWLQNPVWQGVFALLVIAAGLAAWAGSEHDRSAMLSVNRATWLWLTLALAPVHLGRSALGWALVAVVLGLMLLAVGEATNQYWGWRVPLVLSAATLAGVPFTAGMPAQALGLPRSLAVYLLAVAGNALALACVLLDWPRPRPEPEPELDELEVGPNPLGVSLNWPVIRLLLAFSIAAVLTLLWGIQPEALATAGSFGLSQSLGQLLRELGLSGLVAIALSLGLGVGLAQLLRQPNVSQHPWRSRLAQVAGLSWAMVWLSWLWRWVETIWRTVLGVFEGEGYVGWLALLLLLAWLVLRA